MSHSPFVGFDFAADFCRVRLHNKHGEHLFPCRTNGEWQRTTLRFCGDELSTVATTGAWISPLSFAFRFCSIETPYTPTVFCHFEGKRVRLEYRPNVERRSTPYPDILGRRD